MASPRLIARQNTVVRRATQRNASVIALTSNSTESESAGPWRWYPTLSELRTHYAHDLGFLACAIMFLSIVIFCVACICALPPLHTALDTRAKLIGAYWAPSVVGGVGFVISGALFTLETQERWWKPAPEVLGWHIGFWSLVGGVGFTLCGIFGLGKTDWALFQASVSSFWGSWAFLIGSVIQWYESLNKLPVEKAKETS